MTLIEALGWAVVELHNPKPDMEALRAVVNLAYEAAAHLDLKHEVAKDNFVRLARATGGI